jgi:Cu2+-containing amine oxidase
MIADRSIRKRKTMSADRDTTRHLLLESPVNPKTGRTWTLADAEVKTTVADAKKRVLKSSTTAMKFLKSGGFVDARGKLAKKYGG